MAARPPLLWLAVVLLLVIGVSGLYVGVELLAAEHPFGTARGDDPAAIAIPAAIGLYGVAVLLGGIGLLARRRLAHRLALVTITIGLVELLWQATLLGFDPVTLFGVGVWAVVLVLLLTPVVRKTVGGR